jgi:hypothetical protein
MNSFAALSFAPVVPLPVLAALAAAFAAVWGLAALRRARGLWLRLAATVVLLLALANPRLVVEDRQGLPDVALVVVDDTLSQAIGDRRAETDKALAELQDRLAGFGNLEVRVERLATGSGADDGTRLFAAIDRALADVPRRRLAGVVTITDGQVHDATADAGKDWGAPLHVLLTGRPGEADRRLAVKESPSFALVGRTATIRFQVAEPGSQGSAQVAVRVDGTPYLATRVPLNRDASVEVPIRHAGQTVVEIDAEGGPHELSLANNRAVVGVSGVRDRLKVLLVSGEPHAGERTWRNLLKADPAVDLVHFTILRPPEKDDQTPLNELSLITFPVRELFEEKLADFDLVIFDRYHRRNVLTAGYYQSLADYVRQGGALLVAVGPEFAEPGGLYGTVLSGVLPAEPTGAVLAQPFRPQVTAVGRRHPVTAGLPGPESWGRWLRQIAVSRRSGTVVLSGDGEQPLVVLDRVGDGRVAEVLSDTFWLWARGWEGGGPYNELLRRLAHWLMREPDLEEEALAAEVKGDRLEVTRRSLEGDPPAVTVTRPDGSEEPLELADQGDGRATGALAVDQPGLWRVADGVRSAVAAAGSLHPMEMADLTATPERLAPAAAASGGSVRWLAEGGVPEVRRERGGGTQAGRGWIGLAERGDYAVAGVRDVALLPGLALLLLVGGGLLLAWRREGR